MGFKTPKANSTPQFTGIQINTASSIRAVTLAGGLVRMGWNLIDYTDFQSHKHKQKSGKGFGSSTTTFTYSATVVGLLCVGEVAGVGQAWKDNGDVADFASLGYTLFTGSIPQAPWGYMAAAHPDHADGYPGFAYLAKANDDLGSSATLSNYNFEVQALFYATAAGGALPDADPALWTNDFLTNEDHGVSAQLVQFIDAEQLLSGPDAATTGDSAYQTYCRAMGFGISPLMSDQEPAASAVERWCLITNTAPVWTGFSFKLVPYGDEPVTGHGVTWLPPTASRFALTDDDYLPAAGADPLVASRSDPTQAKNAVAFNIRDRANAYNEVPVDAKNDNAIALYGQQDADTVTAREICVPAMGKVMVALYAQRILFTRNGYEFTVGPQFDLLEPMDCGTVSDPELGVAITVRITEIQEGEDNNLNMLAEQFDGTLGSPGATSASSVTPTDINSLVAPGPVNPPLIFEPPSSLAQRLFGSAAPCVVAAVSGGDGTTVNPNWGGCIVWVSTDDATYQAIGEINGPARMGVTTSALAAYGGANPDTVHGVGVTLLESGGDLANAATSADAAAGATLSVLKDAGGALEFFGYELATLTGPNAYDLGAELYRGLYGSAPAAHLAGAAFARLDGNLFKFDIPQAYVGQDLWFKFQSFNIWGNALEDLAGCTAYGPFTPSGAGFGGGLGGVPTEPTGLSVTAGIQSATLQWAANPADDNVTAYQVWRATGLAQIFADAALVQTVAGQTFTDTGLLANQGYTYFLRAVNLVGAGDATTGEDVTTSGLISGGGASAAVRASQAIFAGAYVNVYDAGGGVQRVRLADATDPAKYANGFCLGAIANGADGVVNYTGMNASIAPAAPGEIWLSCTVPGGYQATPPTPATNAGGISQSIGTASLGVGAAFVPGGRFKLAA